MGQAIFFGYTSPDPSDEEESSSGPGENQESSEAYESDQGEEEEESDREVVCLSAVEVISQVTLPVATAKQPSLLDSCQGFEIVCGLPPAGDDDDNDVEAASSCSSLPSAKSKRERADEEQTSVVPPVVEEGDPSLAMPNVSKCRLRDTNWSCKLTIDFFFPFKNARDPNPAPTRRSRRLLHQGPEIAVPRFGKRAYPLDAARNQ